MRWTCRFVVASLALAVCSQALAEEPAGCETRDVQTVTAANVELNRLIPEGASPDEALAVLDTTLSAPATDCAMTAAATVRKVTYLLEAERLEDAKATARLLVTDTGLWESLSRLTRKNVLWDLFNLSEMTGYEDWAIAALDDNRDLLLEDSPQVVSGYMARLFLEEDHPEAAMAFAQAAFRRDTVPIPEMTDSMAEFAMSLGFHVMAVLGEWEEAASLLKPQLDRSDRTELWLNWALAERYSDGTTPEEAVTNAEDVFGKFRPIEEGGYVPLAQSRRYYALLLDAYQYADEIDKAAALKQSVQEKFGAPLDPWAVLDAYITGFTDNEPHTFEDAELLTPVQPKWPPEDHYSSASVSCETRFNVDETGKPFNIRATCSKDLFVDSAEDAITHVRFKPKTIDGVPVVRYNVVQPLEYRLP